MKKKHGAPRPADRTILYFDQAQITDADMIWGFLESGYEDVRIAEKRVPDAEYTETDKAEILAEIAAAERGGEDYRPAHRLLVATKDFSAAVAKACHETNHMYLSWVHDAPQRALYMEEALYETNRVFVFDRVQQKRMEARGLKHVYYRPLATNITRVTLPELLAKDASPFAGEISFVGNLYESAARDAFFAQLKEDTRAACEEILARKTGHWEEGCTVYHPLEKAHADDMRANFSDENRSCYAEEDWDYLMCTATLAQEAAMRERVQVLSALAERFPVTLYTSRPDDARERLPGVTVRPAVSYEEEMPLVFRASKINLNLTSPSIESGVPLRVFDIMGAGGFVLSNDQPEIGELFVKDREIVTASCTQELLEKAAYYLAHDDARAKIAAQGFRKVKERYGCPQAVSAMLRVCDQNPLL